MIKSSQHLDFFFHKLKIASELLFVQDFDSYFEVRDNIVMGLVDLSKTTLAKQFRLVFQVVRLFELRESLDLLAL